VHRSYVTNLRKGRIESPGYEKLAAIAKAMGFPPEAWFDDAPGQGKRAAPAEGWDIARRVEHLFKAVRHQKTGEPYTNAEVVRISAGDLTVDAVEAIRSGRIGDPTVRQVASLAAVFGVEPSYLMDRKEPPSLDAERASRKRRLVLGIVRQFGEAR
jgi:transcriptional regulator with XRE-family HTH domain